MRSRAAEASTRVVDATFIDAWAARLREEIPGAVAVLLKGSYARDSAGPHSDVDLDVLVAPGPVDDYRAWIVEHDGRLVHVSVAVQDLAGWLAERSESEGWAFGLPAHETTRLLWARDNALREQLDVPARVHPPGDAELEDAVEAHGKVHNALRRGDELALRLAAQTLGQLVPSLLRPINPPVAPSHRHAALLAALAFPVAPEGYRDDLLRCLGLDGRASTAGDVHDAAGRLLAGTLALLRAHAAVARPALPPDLFGYLVDGTLERYVGQDTG